MAALAKLRTDFLAELGQTRAAIMGRLDGVERRMTEVREDIALNFGTLDHVTRINDTTREDFRGLRDMVNVMYRTVQRLEANVGDIIDKQNPPRQA
ncbi:MAG: hypothetical protein ABSC06_23840 [Rhodopila sp.]|jgi:hypothetical protein